MRKWIVVLAAMMFSVMSVMAGNPDGKSGEVVRIAGTDYYLHKVAPGETVYSLSKLYGITEQQVYEDNPSVRHNGLKAGEVIRLVCKEIPEQDMSRRKLRRTFIQHMVQPGETAYGIAKRYSIAINTLIEDNPGLDPAHLKAGQELLIRKSEVDKTSPQQIMAQMDSFASTLSEVSNEYVYHLVEMGETLYGISKKYNVGIAEIEAVNDVSNGLKAGVLLKIPVQGDRPTNIQQPYIGVENNVEPTVVNTGLTGMLRRASGVVDISMLLPLSSGNNAVRAGFIEFYEGALIAANELRNQGLNVNLSLFDTERSPETVSKITRTEAFRASDVIIGPVYEEELGPVMDYSERTGIPVVSPLAEVDNPHGKTLYQMAPASEYRYGKLKTLLEGNKNIIFITSTVTDKEFERQIKRVMGDVPYKYVKYFKGTPPEQIDTLVNKRGSENVFIVLAGDETGVDMILAALSSVQNNRTARSLSMGKIEVIGTSKWMHYRNLDRNLFFKLNVSFVTSYHADRGCEAVVDFDRQYIEAFGRIPTLYSYRGYDAVKIFGVTAASDSWSELQGVVETPLQTPYSFRATQGGNTDNVDWPLVTYGSDYTITVK